MDRLFPDSQGQDRIAQMRHFEVIIENPDNHTFIAEHNGHTAGVFILFNLGEGNYETHVVFIPPYRGLKAVLIGKEATRYVLNLPYVNMLVAAVPMTIRESIVFAMAVGWKALGELPTEWVKNGNAFAMRGFSVTKGDLC